MLESSLLEYIANALTGNDIVHYNFGILDRTNEQIAKSDQCVPLVRKDGMMVSAGALNVAGIMYVTSSQGWHPRHPGIGRHSQYTLQKRSVATQDKEYTDS